MRRPAGRLALRLILTFGLLGVVLLVVAEPSAVLARLAGASLPATVAALALTLADRAIMALKWRFLLTVRGVPLGWWTALRAYYASSFAGLFLPVTVGADLIRVLALRHLGVQQVSASIVVERLVGAVAMGSVAVIGSAILAALLTDLSLRPMLLGATALVLGAGLAFVASLFLAGRWVARRPGGQSFVATLLEAYASYQHHRGAVALFYLASVGESLLPSLVAYAAAVALGVSVPFWTLMATVPISYTVARLPVTLGGFGVLEASFVYLGGLVGIASSDALSIMLLSDAVLLVALLPAAVDTEMLGLGRRGADRPDAPRDPA